MPEHCRYCGLCFETVREALATDSIHVGLGHHLLNCPPIVSEDGELRLVDALCDYRQSGKKTGLGQGGGRGTANGSSHNRGRAPDGLARNQRARPRGGEVKEMGGGSTMLGATSGTPTVVGERD